MREYRINSIGEDGQIVSVKHFECNNDGDAIEKAQAMAGAHGVVELWQSTRLIKKIGERSSEE
jgi:hypothetical protein